MSLTGSFRNAVTLVNSKTGVDLTIPQESLNETAQKSISTGSLYHDEKALTAAQVYALDFTDSSLTDVFGAAIAVNTITGLYIVADSGNDGTIQITTGTTSWMPTMPALAAGESFALLSDVDISTNVKLYVTDGGDAGTFKIVVTGETVTP